MSVSQKNNLSVMILAFFNWQANTGTTLDGNQSMLKDNSERFRCSRPRVARWFIFKPKFPIWEKYGGP
jgi:hypothetical protein